MSRRRIDAIRLSQNQLDRAIDLREYLFGPLSERLNRDQQIGAIRNWLEQEHRLGRRSTRRKK